MADDLATQARRALTWQQREQQPLILPASQIAESINNKIITQTVDKEVQEAYTAIDFRAHLEQKFKWNKDTTDRIDWEVHGGNLLKI
eukprot:4360599-Ditylum_brightwellii.AAC.1